MKHFTHLQRLSALLVFALAALSMQAKDITIYVKAATAPYLYAWEGENNFEAGWPGTLLSDTKEYDGQTFYYKTYTVEESLNIIFTAGQSGPQTANIEGITEDAYYTYDGGTGYAVYTAGGGGDEPTPTPTPTEYPATLYLIGNVNDWNTETAVAATGTEGVYTWEKQNLKSALNAYAEETGFTYFSFNTTTGEDWNAVNGADRYGAPTADAEITSGTATTVKKYTVNVDASACKSWKATAGTYNISVDLSKMTVTITTADPTGITGIEATTLADAPRYNIAGQQVSKSHKGLVIQNGKKMLVK